MFNSGGVRFGSSEIYKFLSDLALLQWNSNGPNYAALSASLYFALRTPDKSDEVVVLNLVVPDSISDQKQAVLRRRRQAGDLLREICQTSCTLTTKRVTFP